MSEREPIYYVNGDFVKKSQAKISVNDLGLLRSYGIFDYLITYRERTPFLLPDHLRRFSNSASLIDLKLPWTESDLYQISLATLERNNWGDEKSIRLVATGGESVDSITPAETPTLIVKIDDFKPYSPEYYQKGAKIITVNYRRHTPEAKTLEYTEAVKIQKIIKREGAIEAVYVDEDSNVVYEGTTSNIFIVKNGVISTPAVDILKGITRQETLRIAGQEFRVATRWVTTPELYTADEIFLTSSNKEIMPIVNVDGQMVGNGNVGPVTKQIMHQFRQFALEGIR